jgi:hypothetical protein
MKSILMGDGDPGAERGELCLNARIA